MMSTRGSLASFATAILPTLVVTLFLPAHASAETFTYTYHDGDKYRILSTVEQSVTIDGVFSHSARILNRIAVDVPRTKDGSGYLVADFQTSEEATKAQQLFKWGEEYHSEFWQGPQGYEQIDPKYFMPVVRDVPVFPDRDIAPGETWSADGTETHDFRANFGIPDPYSFPIPVTYKYMGKTTENGKEFDLIAVKYNVFYRPTKQYQGIYPTLITGSSDQKVYWDPVAGRADHYQETYAFYFTLSNGQNVLYEGTAHAETIDSSPLDRAKVESDIRGNLKDMGVKDTEVKSDDRGVTISLENIQFLPDSAVLVDSEKDKLKHVAEILKKYPDRDLLITGYTALAGTEQGRRLLSEQRAEAVGQFLIDLGVRTREHLTYRGMGANNPIADNSTEEGMKKNRRVEITIMEN